MALKQIPSTYSPNWFVIVNQRLMDGFGVEDIAIEMCADVEIVRFHVRKLRSNGALSKWFNA